MTHNFFGFLDNLLHFLFQVSQKQLTNIFVKAIFYLLALIFTDYSVYKAVEQLLVISKSIHNLFY